MDADTLMRKLLPQPRGVRLDGTGCPITSTWHADVRCDDSRIHRAAKNLIAFAESARLDRPVPDHARTVRLQISNSPSAVSHQQGYLLTIVPGRVELVGGSAAGCFHGLQTLRQIVEATRGEQGLPCCTIEDEPDFETRGLLHDVTRGKVPTLSTLKHIAERLAAWKCNQFQLYIEHAFTFSFDPDICDEAHGLTPDEIRQLDDYCRERFIDLVPAVATFGHMGRILSLPRYRHLAEIEASTSWERMTWPQRARGLTLDCMNPESHRLVERIWSDILDAFSSPVVNICGDEPWDLGRGRNSDRLGDNHGHAYLEHIRRTHEYCANRGRSTQFWSDVLRNYPALFHKVPRDATVLHWGYDDTTDYEATRSLAEAGMNIFVCPGTRGWKRILNALDAAERNIHSFTQAGKKYGATGIINTDWGDHGHFNMLACSWHAIALGAALAWSASHPTGREFDRLFTQQLFACDNSASVASLRSASALADTSETWKLLWMPNTELVPADLPSQEKLTESAYHAGEAVRQLQSHLADSPACNGIDIEELILACRVMELLSHKISNNRAYSPQSPGNEGIVNYEQYHEYLGALAHEYARLWNIRNKPSGLNDILNALARIGCESDRAVVS